MSLTKASFSMISGASVNVLDFGADNTGATDATSAIQAAIDSGANRVWFPVGTYLANNLLLPASGITLEGENPYSTIITNNHASNHTLRTNNAVSANLWVFVNGLTFNMGLDGQSGDAIHLPNVEQYLVENCRVTTPPTYATTGNGVYVERTASGSRGYYGTVRKCFIEKQGRGVYFKGGNGYNLNVSLIDDCVINNSTNEGVLFEYCSRARLENSSLELNENNVKIVYGTGNIVAHNYFERPDTHNVILDNATACYIHDNQFSSAGNVSTSTGRGVYVASGSQFNRIYDNVFIDNWSAYEIEVVSGALQTLIRDNIARDRVNGWGDNGTAILDNGTQTVYVNPLLSSGGTMFVKSKGQALSFDGFTTPAGVPAKIGETQAGIYAGTGLPEGSVTAAQGSIFLRTNGGAGFTFYVKESGTGNTGWVAK